jgi:hypothetical protein
MNETTGEPEGAAVPSGALPNVTQIPLQHLVTQDGSVLDQVIRRLVQDAVDQRDITAAFGNTP